MTIMFCHPCCKLPPYGSVKHCKCNVYTWDNFYPISIGSTFQLTNSVGNEYNNKVELDERMINLLNVWLSSIDDTDALENIILVDEISHIIEDNFNVLSLHREEYIRALITELTALG